MSVSADGIESSFDLGRIIDAAILSAAMRRSVDPNVIFSVSLGSYPSSFPQTYEADTYSDEVTKTLVLVWLEESWRIASEKSSS